MASLTKKTIHGKPYYYLRETARVDGKPKVVRNEYIGTADDLASLISGGGAPDKSRHLDFGDIAGVWSVLERLDVVGIIDSVVGEKFIHGKATVGQYIALIVLNRIVSPSSKLAFEDWWKNTAGQRICSTGSASMDHRKFWNAMDTINQADLVEIERQIFTKMIELFKLNVSGLSLDMTNFATFVDSGNARNTIAQRGHAKQKRNDLRLVGLGLVVTKDGAIPIASHVYPGNKPDVTQFADMITELVARYDEIAPAHDLTVVYDAGQNSADNYKVIDEHGLNFVSSVPPSSHPDLLRIDVEEYSATAIEGVSVYDTTATLFGRQRRTVLSHSQSLHDKQVRGFTQTIDKASAKLDELASRLERGNTRRHKEAVAADVKAICADTWLSRVVNYDITGDDPKSLRLAWSVDDKARRELEREIFGKRLLFTNRSDWSAEEVVVAYRSQSEVESDFRQMKDPHVVGVGSLFHWTDQKIRVQLFCCVLALCISRLMLREARRNRVDVSSVRDLLGELHGIQQTVLIYETGGRPRVRNMITDMRPQQRRLYDLFGLEAFAPKR